MEKPYFEDKQFERLDCSTTPFQIADYEGCKFQHSNLSAATLSGSHFIDCIFIGCNLSMAKLIKTAFKNVQFKDCKLTGLHFDDCEPFLFEVAFDHCGLEMASFYRMKMQKTKFLHCILKTVEFSESNLEQSVFSECDLNDAIFNNTRLEKADFRTAYNYVIDPALNKIKKAKFGYAGISGLLQQFDIVIE